MSSRQIMDAFSAEYLDDGQVALGGYRVSTHDSGEDEVDQLDATIVLGGVDHEATGIGNGPIAAFVAALSSLGVEVSVRDYHEHAMEGGATARAAAYVEAEVDGEVTFGVGIHRSIVTASLRAVLSAVNRGRRLAAARSPEAAAAES